MKQALVAGIVVLAWMAAIAQQSQPSTPEERKRAVEVAHRIQADPLNPRHRADRDWLVEWVERIPDITVPICPGLLPLVNDHKERYKYAPELAFQSMAGATVFLIQHPGKKDADFEINRAAVEAALTAYENILKSRPRAHWQQLDDLVARRNTKTLDDYIKAQTFRCLESGDHVIALVR